MENKMLDEFVLQGLIAHIPYAIFWKDTNFVFLGCNKEFARQFGFNEPRDVIGKTDHDFPFAPHLREKYRNDDKEVLGGSSKLNYEEEQTQPDGTVKTVWVSKTPLYDNKKEIIGILGIYTDITERKKQERELIEAKNQAEIANKAKTEFLENMRHDLRTPLTGITGFANILKKEAKGSKFEEYAENIADAGESLLFLLNEILEAVHVTSGELPLLKRKFDLKKVLNDIVKLNQPRAKEKKLNLTIHYDDHIPAYCIGDAKRIQRIALELITNALNFTDQGSITLSAELAKIEEKDFVIKLIVTDTGIGIPHNKQQEVFTRFKRLIPSYQGIYKGAGLGLAIVKQFIDELDGEIYVESELKKGTQFTCIIPLKISLLDDDFGVSTIDSSRYATPPVTQICSNIAENPLTENNANHLSQILLVEDNPIAAKIITVQLHELGCVVHHAEKGETAVTMALQKRFDIIFMDIGLPGISGIEATQQIRQNEEKNKFPVPIVAITAHVSNEESQQCLYSGINAVLLKPVEANTMRDILNAFIPSRVL